jgi:prevent-host-death family protein
LAIILDKNGRNCDPVAARFWYGPRFLPSPAHSANLVGMTRFPQPSPPSPTRPTPPPGHWLLQDAKARFSELVRRVRSDGPQHVTVHGRDEVVVIAAEDLRRLQGGHTGQALVDVLQASPCRDVELALAPSVAASVRDVEL